MRKERGVLRRCVRNSHFFCFARRPPIVCAQVMQHVGSKVLGSAAEKAGERLGERVGENLVERMAEGTLVRMGERVSERCVLSWGMGLWLWRQRMATAFHGACAIGTCTPSLELLFKLL